MFDYNKFDNSSDEGEKEPYPDFFLIWDEAINKGESPGYFDVEDLCSIIEIYLTDGEIAKAKQAIDYSLKLYPGNDELIYEVLLLLNDFELWNDLLTLSERFKDMSEVWADGHKVTALLHLGMEEDAFHFFKRLKSKYSDNKENLSIVYQAMGEALHEVDLFDASINVIDEAISLIGEDVDFYWLQLQSYLSLEVNEKVNQLALKIQKLNPLNAETWYRLGNVYKEIDETEKSIEAFEFAQSLGYKDSNNLINLIYAYEKNGNFNKALEKAKEYLLLYPDSYVVNLIAANVCDQMERWDDALKYVENAIEIIPTMESLYLYKSNFLLKLGEQRKAILALEEGIKKTQDTQGELTKELERLQKLYPNY